MADNNTELVKEWKQVSSLLNFAHPSSFVLEVPVGKIGIGAELETIGYKNNMFALNINDFTLGRMQLKVNAVKKSGYELYYPSGVEETNKVFTVNYTLSSEYQQYYFLVRWYEKNLEVIKHITETLSTSTEDTDEDDFIMVPIKIWCLNENKDPVMVITYEQAFLSELGELQLSYQSSSNVLVHSFTCYYNDFKIQLLDPTTK